VEIEEDALRVVISLHRLLRSLRRATPAQAVQPTQLIVLTLLLETGPLRIGTIAERVPCSQPSATHVVAGLESDGLVRRERDPEDGRATRIMITDKGLSTIKSLAHGQAQELARRLGSLSNDDVTTLLAADPVLRALADADTEPGPL
jgi:DNA-binding MarR family transcriptional regulator